MTIRRGMLPIMLLAALTGCVSARDATVTLTHTPATLAEAPFAIRAGAFTRTLPDKILDNQYETTGYTFNKQISLSSSLADYLKTAFVQESRKAGVSLRDEPSCRIDAALSRMALKSNGWSKIVFSGDVAYTVTPATGSPLAVAATASQESDTTSAEAAHSRFITALVDGLLKDPKFIAFARANCPRKSA